MPITNGTYTCKFCNQSFKAKSDDYYDCQCGKSSIKPNERNYTGYSYKNENQVVPVEGETYYLPEEFIQLSQKSKEIIEEIRVIIEQSKYKNHHYSIYESKEPGKNGELYLSGINITIDQLQSEYSSGMNTLHLTLNLCKTNHTFISEDIEERLSKFLTFMKRIEENTLRLSNYSEMSQLAEEQDLYESRQQVEIYDYTFYV